MSTIAKTILGATALATIGAWIFVAAESPARATAPDLEVVATISVKGKVANRLGGERLAGAEAAARLNAAHGLAAPEDGAADCQSHSWPNIPAACLTPADGASARRAVRVVGAAAETAVGR